MQLLQKCHNTVIGLADRVRSVNPDFCNSFFTFAIYYGQLTQFRCPKATGLKGIYCYLRCVESVMILTAQVENVCIQVEV